LSLWKEHWVVFVSRNQFTCLIFQGNEILYSTYSIIVLSFETIICDLPYFSCENCNKNSNSWAKGFPSVFLVQFCNPLFLPQTSFKRCYHELKNFVCYRVLKFNFHFFIQPYNANFYTGNTKQTSHSLYYWNIGLLFNNLV